jgi:hypothetical protein
MSDNILLAASESRTSYGQPPFQATFIASLLDGALIWWV